MNNVASYHYIQAFNLFNLYGQKNNYNVKEEIKYLKSKMQCSN